MEILVHCPFSAFHNRWFFHVTSYFCFSLYSAITHHLLMILDGHIDTGIALWNIEHINISSNARGCVVEPLLLFPCCIAAGCSPETNK
jgi:hypothetical protein